MASPPQSRSPAGSPPYAPHSEMSSKKRPSVATDIPIQSPVLKRRKASTMSVASAGSAHPLRQTSFPPDDTQSRGAYSPSSRRSPSIDTMSLVSGSQVSSAPAKKKRGRKSKAELANEAAAAANRDGTPGAAGGRAGAVNSNAGVAVGKDGEDGAKDGDEGGMFDMPENMAIRSATRTKQQIEDEKELRALLKQQMDENQFDRYEVWHRASIKSQDVKRHVNSITSQSCPPSVHQMMQVVCKMFLGDIVELAREVQQEWIELGEKQTDLESDALEPSSEYSKFRRQAPLRPDHLREAARRRKANSESGGTLGSLSVWNQQTSNGLERFATRAGGRRIFK